ncbi:chromate transporter [Paenibacillus sp. J2TS4]|uniref:chromate transporter n=1 Tax=Paenibacillus sp. J2TS4 TaxID=2807194 RepID=UPI001B0BE2E2|nr:chromate transporter [Paenibacillus sp. J2TS4]GIP31536.1 chromate transporter [Paenibacillus sp. J2TS4]
MLLLNLFWTFFKVGLFSFGGGYAMIPVIEHEVTTQGWMTSVEYNEAIALAGMSPGPIATNGAVYVGYHTAGLAGALAATLGMVLPSLLLIVIIASFFIRINEHKLVKSAFYGLRPIVAGLVAYAGVNFSYTSGIIGEISWQSVIAFTIFAAALFALFKYKLHPLYVIVFSALAGAAFYS